MVLVTLKMVVGLNVTAPAFQNSHVSIDRQAAHTLRNLQSCWAEIVFDPMCKTIRIEIQATTAKGRPQQGRQCSTLYGDVQLIQDFTGVVNSRQSPSRFGCNIELGSTTHYCRSTNHVCSSHQVSPNHDANHYQPQQHKNQKYALW